MLPVRQKFTTPRKVSNFILCNPVEIMAVRMDVLPRYAVKMELAQPDASGRRRPVLLKAPNSTSNAMLSLLQLATHQIL